MVINSKLQNISEYLLLEQKAGFGGTGGDANYVRIVDVLSVKQTIQNRREFNLEGYLEFVDL